MDLSAYYLPKIRKVKRERQPNWTEPEKQLLLSLTRIHQSILENKGSDTITLKRKSKAWDDIALHMKTAGFNRSKDRLKQQLGRIRAAGVKRAKEAFEKGQACTSSSTCLNLPINSQTLDDNPLKIGGHSSMCVDEEIHIKVEKMPIMDDEDDDGLIENRQPRLSSPIKDSLESNISEEDNTRDTPQNMTRFILQNIQSLNDIRNVSSRINATKNTEEASLKESSTADLPASTNSNNLMVLNPVLNTCSTNDDSRSISDRMMQRKRQQSRQVRLTGVHAREQRLKQIHMYRMAVERERLRSLKVQQKRDRLLYRKDVQIQNLKLRILRNLVNQNPDGNSLTF